MVTLKRNKHVHRYYRRRCKNIYVTENIGIVIVFKTALDSLKKPTNMIVFKSFDCILARSMQSTSQSTNKDTLDPY